MMQAFGNVLDEAGAEPLVAEPSVYAGYFEFLQASYLSGNELLIAVRFGKDNVLLKFRQEEHDKSWRLLYHARLDVQSLDLLDLEEMLSSVLEEKTVRHVRSVDEEFYYGYQSYVDESYTRKNHIYRLSSNTDVAMLETLSPVAWDNSGVIYFDNGVPHRLNLASNTTEKLPDACFADRGEQIVQGVKNFLLLFEGNPYFFEVGESGRGDSQVKVTGCGLGDDVTIALHHNDLGEPMELSREDGGLVLQAKTRKVELF